MFIYRFSTLTLFFKVDLEALFVYHTMSKEAPPVVGMPVEGFFNGTDVVAKAMASASATAE